MNRRNFVVGLVKLGSLVGLLFGRSNVCKASEVQVVIPESVRKEISDILRKGGQITGYSYSCPASYEGSMECGQRYLTKPEERRWKLT